MNWERREARKGHSSAKPLRAQKMFFAAFPTQTPCKNFPFQRAKIFLFFQILHKSRFDPKMPEAFPSRLPSFSSHIFLFPNFWKKYSHASNPLLQCPNEHKRTFQFLEILTQCTTAGIQQLKVPVVPISFLAANSKCVLFSKKLVPSHLPQYSPSKQTTQSSAFKL